LFATYYIYIFLEGLESISIIVPKKYNEAEDDERDEIVKKIGG
jgi:hypothetical protein